MTGSRPAGPPLGQRGQPLLDFGALRRGVQTSAGRPLDAANVRHELRAVCKKAGIGERWTPRELRHTLVSLMSDTNVAVEEIARLVGHTSSKVTETVYRHQLRPLMTTGAEKMDTLLRDAG